MSNKLIKKRPISPHLQIYKPQITTVLSILHRITGAALFFGIIMLSWLMIMILIQALGLGFFEVDFSLLIENIFFKLVVLGIVYCLYYHFLNGIRHLYWDMGYGVNNRSVTISGIIVITLALSLTGITYFIALYNAF
jgi:succinate dehydrogenase / fumarate reductase cytochrome b subunit